MSIEKPNDELMVTIRCLALIFSETISLERSLVMKKKYFLSQNVTEMGGAQIYERNKSTYLTNKGWDVDVFSFQKGKVYIEELKKYEPCNVSCIRE